jgi:hypothetical protein
MPVAAINWFDCASEDVAKKQHDFNADSFKIFLTNTAPDAAAHTAYDGTTGSTGPAEIAAGNGYTAGGNTCAVVSAEQTAGLTKVILDSPAQWAGSGTGFGPLQWAVLYNATNNKLLCWWGYAEAIEVDAGETLDVGLDEVDGVIELQTSAI